MEQWHQNHQYINYYSQQNFVEEIMKISSTSDLVMNQSDVKAAAPPI